MLPSSVAGNVPSVKITRGFNNSIARSMNGRVISSSGRVGVRPPGVRQNTIGTMDTVSRLCPIAFSILSINSPVGPDRMWPVASSSEPGMSVTIINLPLPMCGNTVLVAVARSG